jgi:hypothetical protein
MSQSESLAARQQAQVVTALYELEGYGCLAYALEVFATHRPDGEFWDAVLVLASTYPDVAAKLTSIRTIDE